MSDVFLRNASVEESPLQADLMLFDPEQNRFFVLNPTMAYLWRHCDGHTPMQRLIEQIGLAFAGTEQAPYAEDVHSALKDLLSMGLVTRI